MPKYRVPVTAVTRLLFEIEAPTKEEAMNEAIERFDCGESTGLIEETEGDSEVNFFDITEVMKHG